MKKTIYGILGIVLCIVVASKCMGNSSSENGENGTAENTEQTLQTPETQGVTSDSDASADAPEQNAEDADEAAKVSVSKQIEIPAPLKDRKEQIIRHKAYTVSYNSNTKIPNWVAWKLTPARFVENYSRKEGEFLPDPQLPESEAVTTDDYKGSGWDRGHMCPANDNRWDWKAMRECFFMTNMCPQHSNLNRGDWKELEDACHDWAVKEGAIYIVCGPILYRQAHETIGYHHVVVPEAFFKVVLCLGKHPKAIGFIYKNNRGNNPLDSYVNSVDQVERITKIDFFPALPDNLEKKVEAQRNVNNWQMPDR
jgi:endonuclease G